MDTEGIAEYLIVVCNTNWPTMVFNTYISTLSKDETLYCTTKEKKEEKEFVKEFTTPTGTPLPVPSSWMVDPKLVTSLLEPFRKVRPPHG